VPQDLSPAPGEYKDEQHTWEPRHRKSRPPAARHDAEASRYEQAGQTENIFNNVHRMPTVFGNVMDHLAFEVVFDDTLHVAHGLPSYRWLTPPFHSDLNRYSWRTIWPLQNVPSMRGIRENRFIYPRPGQMLRSR
jgi:hypothetical protein